MKYRAEGSRGVNRIEKESIGKKEHLTEAYPGAVCAARREGRVCRAQHITGKLGQSKQTEVCR